MKKVIVTLGKVFLNCIYYIFRILPVEDQVVFISMQSNKKSLDFEMLEECLKFEDPSAKLVFLCKKMESKLSTKLDYIKYVFCMTGYVLKAMYYLASSRVCVTESYCVPISILKHRKDLTILQIWHASGAVKKFGYQSLDTAEGKSKELAEIMCMHKNYNYAIAPSEVTREIFSKAFNIEKEKIVKLGLPRLEYITDSRYNKAKEIYSKYPELQNKKVILYAPTFRNGKNIDLTEILNYPLDKSKYKLIIKLHPLAQNIVPEENIIDSKYTSYDLIKIADYIITDYSALSIEASLLEKPIFIYNYDIDEYEKDRGLNVKFEEELKTFTSKKFSDIMSKIEKSDFDIGEIIRYKEKYIEVDIKDTTTKLSKFILSIF